MFEVRLCKVDSPSGTVVASRRARSAPIKEIVALPGIVAVCEEPIKRGTTNVYALNEDLDELLWEAEPPGGTDFYVGFLGVKTRADYLGPFHPSAVAYDVSKEYPTDYLFLICASWGGVAFLIDPQSGETKMKVITK
jgi:hypothetical protein